MSVQLFCLQALVYHNKKCVGRFIKPRLYSVSQFGDTREEQFADCPVQQLSIIYDCFKAACTDGPAKVSVPIVTADAFEQYRFTVVGRCEECNFVLPVTYQFSGQQVAYNLQKSLYTTKHQQSQAAAAGTVSALSPLITNSDLALNFGRSSSYHSCMLWAKQLSTMQIITGIIAGTGLELFSAVFEPEADSAWLKCLILKFCLVAQSSLHEAGPALSESESSVSVTSCPTQHTEASRPQKTSQPATSSKMPSNAKSVSKKQKQKQNSRAAALASRHSDSSKSSASKEVQAEKPEVQWRDSAHSGKSMAVPAASEDQAVAANGFTARGMLNTAPKGTSLPALLVFCLFGATLKHNWYQVADSAAWANSRHLCQASLLLLFIEHDEQIIFPPFSLQCLFVSRG